ncbi:DUF6630 family protein [Pseudobacteroides cellulosolvens]|uniref:DUF6630 domain-containing protein n=1 Tax=Pseudobacteroides cellulosolvens ATCC 35603 = DSM 2933 TaxID=398512 RepID=A0A0L6JT37_9FIRM|nr:DUF6630 family protein [Pseudobacteroides cellulosolvens]KNY28859.1 hypothetical protein Bccel_4133 [Pseudobacteroides cellulosolvens ATCC 35603 = DSM 2933]
MTKEKRDALLELARKLSMYSNEVEEDIILVLENPKEYIKKYASRLEDRGIYKPDEDLPWVALADALIERKLAWEIDWQHSLEEVFSIINTLIIKRGFVENKQSFYKSCIGVKLECILVDISKRLSKSFLTLIYLDIDSDSYVLVVIPKVFFAEACQLAEKAGYSIRSFI